MHHIDVQATQDPFSSNHPWNVPPLRRPDGTLPTGSCPLVCGEDKRFETCAAQLDGEPTRVVGDPVSRRVQEAADKTNPLTTQEQTRLVSVDADTLDPGPRLMSPRPPDRSTDGRLLRWTADDMPAGLQLEALYPEQRWRTPAEDEQVANRG